MSDIEASGSEDEFLVAIEVPLQFGNDENPTVDVVQTVLSVTDRTSSPRCCWICFETDEEDEQAEWVKPCKCRGIMKWVHEACLQRWVDEKEGQTEMGIVKCSQCLTEYKIVYPSMGITGVILDFADILIDTACFFICVGIDAGVMYWSALAYGASTLLEVIGQNEGLRMIQHANNIVLFIGLPAIPTALIDGRTIRWDDGVLHSMRCYISRGPIIRHIIPLRGDRTTLRPNFDGNLQSLRHQMFIASVLCGALLIPTISTVVGKMFLKTVKSGFRQVVLGGVMFIVIKGSMKMYCKRYIPECRRQILDHPESND